MAKRLAERRARIAGQIVGQTVNRSETAGQPERQAPDRIRLGRAANDNDLPSFQRAGIVLGLVAALASVAVWLLLG